MGTVVHLNTEAIRERDAEGCRLRALVAAAMVLLVGFSLPRYASAEHSTIFDSPYPATIRVAIRESMPSGEPDPLGRILYVKSVPFDEYVIHSLPHEWVPAWEQEAVQAGSMAVKMFAWYKILHPTTLDGWEFDVDNTTNFQTYRETGRFANTDEAHWRVRNLAFAEADGTIAELNYRAGVPDQPNWPYRNANLMAQWGTQYWAEQGYNMLQILQWYYQGRVLHPIPGLQANSGGEQR